jgi:hypothetical protein
LKRLTRTYPRESKVGVRSVRHELRSEEQDNRTFSGPLIRESPGLESEAARIVASLSPALCWVHDEDII